MKDNGRLFDKWHMVAQDLIGACDGNRDNGTTGLGGDLESALLERCHLTGLGTRSLREYKDGDTTLDIIDGCEDHTQTVSGIGMIQKKRSEALRIHTRAGVIFSLSLAINPTSPGQCV